MSYMQVNFKYMQQKCVSWYQHFPFLHLFYDAGESQTFLDWKQRLQIALDTAIGEE